MEITRKVKNNPKRFLGQILGVGGGGQTFCKSQHLSGTDRTGRPGCRTTEMIGGSSAPYLARTPCVPLFCTSFNRVGNKERFRLPGAGGGSFPLYGGTFARSYSVSNFETIFITPPPKQKKTKNNFGAHFCQIKKIECVAPKRDCNPSSKSKGWAGPF